MTTETYLVDVRSIDDNGESVCVAHARGFGDLLAVGDSYADAIDALSRLVAHQHVVRKAEQEEAHG